MPAEHPVTPSPHPSVAGREQELSQLVAGVRRLVEVVNRDALPPDVLTAVADRLESVVARVEQLVPDPVPPRLASGGGPGPPGFRNPYDVVHGPYNPLAPPLVLRHEPPDAVAEVTFGAAYEGPPGRVHGAVLVGAFDMVLSSANSLTGVTGPTASLRIHYERATRTGVPVEFRARQIGVVGRRIQVEGELHQEGRLTCRAAGLFIQVDPDDLIRLGDDDG